MTATDEPKSSRFVPTQSAEKIPTNDRPEVMLMVNDENKVAIITHDAEKLTLDKVKFSKATSQILIFSKEEPDGHLWPEIIEPEIAETLEANDEIIYANIASDTGKIIQEAILPLIILPCEPSAS